MREFLQEFLGILIIRLGVLVVVGLIIFAVFFIPAVLICDASALKLAMASGIIGLVFAVCAAIETN